MLTFNPFDTLATIQDELNRIFDQSLGVDDHTAGVLERSWNPPVDLFENGDEFIIRMDVPGLELKDIDIAAVDNSLVIKGERKELPEAEKESYVRRERFRGQIQRNITFPAKVDRDKISAVYKNGVLELKCPKAEESKVHQITIAY